MRVLAVGAHPDDAELGCGGALALHADRGDEVHLLVMTAGELGDGGSGVRREEQQGAMAVLGVARLHWLGLPDGGIADDRSTVVAVEAVVGEVLPDLVYGHAPDDTHYDHRATCAATLVACRRVPTLLLYETLTTTRRFQPARYADVSGSLDRKLQAVACHASQVAAGRIRPDVVRAKAVVRGAEVGLEAAEAFEVERAVVSL